MTPAGIAPAASRASISAWTDCDTAPVSSLVISPLIVAAGASSTRVMLPWTSACTTVATSASGTVRTVPTGRASRSSTEVVASGSIWTTRAMGLPGSNVTVVAVVATSAERTSAATWAAVNPTEMALFGSTMIWISGVALTRSLLRLMTPGVSSRAARTATEASSTSTGSGPLTTTVSPFDVKPRGRPDDDVDSRPS